MSHLQKYFSIGHNEEFSVKDKLSKIPAMIKDQTLSLLESELSSFVADQATVEIDATTNMSIVKYKNYPVKEFDEKKLGDLISLIDARLSYLRNRYERLILTSGYSEGYNAALVSQKLEMDKIQDSGWFGWFDSSAGSMAGVAGEKNAVTQARLSSIIVSMRTLLTECNSEIVKTANILRKGWNIKSLAMSIDAANNGIENVVMVSNAATKAQARQALATKKIMDEMVQSHQAQIDKMWSDHEEALNKQAAEYELIISDMSSQIRSLTKDLQETRDMMVKYESRLDDLDLRLLAAVSQTLISNEEETARTNNNLQKIVASDYSTAMKQTISSDEFNVNRDIKDVDSSGDVAKLAARLANSDRVGSVMGSSKYSGESGNIFQDQVKILDEQGVEIGVKNVLNSTAKTSIGLVTSGLAGAALYLKRG
jgi:uncharacterized coiled-coil protein SlyX